MRKNYPLFVLICVLSINAYAQSSSTDTETSSLPKNQITIKPVSLLDPVNPCIELGYERTLNRLFSAKVGGGPILPDNLLFWILDNISNVNSRDIRDYSGFKSNVEFRINFSHQHSWSQHIAIEGFYISNKYPKEGSFYDQVADRYDDVTFDAHKIRRGANLKFGIQYSPDRITSTLWVGCGFQSRTIEYVNIPSYYESFEDYYNSGLFDFYNDDYEITEILPNLVISYTLGYRF